MSNLVRDHSSSLLAKHAAAAALLALAVVGVGALLGYAAGDLYETANRWVLKA